MSSRRWIIILTCNPLTNWLCCFSSVQKFLRKENSIMSSINRRLKKKSDLNRKRLKKLRGKIDEGIVYFASWELISHDTEDGDLVLTQSTRVMVEVYPLLEDYVNGTCVYYKLVRDVVLFKCYLVVKQTSWWAS